MGSRFPLFLLSLPVLLAAQAACAGDDQQGGDADQARILADVYERPCRTQVVSGDIGEPGRNDLVIGPVTFYAARDLAAEGSAQLAAARRPPGAWGSARKSVTVVEPGVRATVIVPEEHRDSFLLIYRRFASHIGRYGAWYPRSSANAAIRFPGCEAAPEGQTHAFNGGFLVRKPGCYEIVVVSEEDPEPERAPIGFGMGPEGCPDGP